MALNGNTMGEEVVTALEGVDGSMTSDQITQLMTAWKAICGAIVSHIQANAVVLPTALTSTPTIPVQVSPPSYTGATTAAEPILGTGTIE
jgi:hypothetical protein